MLLTKLKEATRAEHAAIEGELRIMEPSFSRLDYAQLIARFYGFYQPLEKLVVRFPAAIEQPIDYFARRKAPHLHTDLIKLGIAPESVGLCGSLPPLLTDWDALGCLYVVEGSTLGGNIISRYIDETLGFHAGNGAAFFNCYGEAVGERWKSFKESLECLVPSSQHEPVIRSAIATFQRLRLWLARLDEVAC